LRDAIEADTPITVSIGCAERWRGETADGVIRRADDMLLSAKRNGKNAVHTTPAAA
jgi:PleD family two-component response regulator